MQFTRPVLIGALSASLLTTAIATAARTRETNTAGVDQQLLSRSISGAMPNAPATDPVISGDGRVARDIAYTSTATDIQRGSGGQRNVYLVKRSGSSGAWKIGSAVLASAGIGGQPANGDSSSPALDGATRGDSSRGPTCLAFVSSASNLVAADDNGQADVFVRRLSSGSLTRIASPAGKPATEVGVSGTCKAIVYVAGNALYVKRGSAHPKRVASGKISSPRSTFNSVGLSYAKGSSIYAGSIGGKVKKVASGADPAPDGGDPGKPQGKIRYVSYERGGSVYYRRLGGFNRRVGKGTGAQPTAGGGQVMFGVGPYVYLYAVSNNFGKASPQGFCPAGGGDVTHTSPSGRGNYIVFSCSGGAVYLSDLGGK